MESEVKSSSSLVKVFWLSFGLVRIFCNAVLVRLLFLLAQLVTAKRWNAEEETGVCPDVLSHNGPSGVGRNESAFITHVVVAVVFPF